MRLFGIALAAAALALAGASTAYAQKSGAAPAISKDQRDKGMKEAPAVVQSAGVPCTVTDAYLLGSAPQKNSAGKDVKAPVYEVACKEGMGYVLIAIPGEKPKSYDCLTASSSPSMACKLPANAHPAQGLAEFVTAAGQTCNITDARSIGSNPQGQSYFEVACRDHPGFILKTAAPGSGGAPTVVSCLDAMGSQLECKLTSKEQILANLNQLMTKAGTTCQVSDVRGIGVDTKTGAEYVEVACGPKPGYVLSLGKNGALERVVDCAKAEGIGGGCTMTNAAAAETQEAGVYTQLAQKSGFNCQVSKYRFIGLDEKKNEAVELACSNRPDGAIGLFPADNSKGQIFDCVQAGALGQECKLTSPALVYPKYTAALKARGKTTCQVSGARYMGRIEKAGTDVVETACADGMPGWVLELDRSDHITNLYSCPQAAGMGLACKLPTNVKH